MSATRALSGRDRMSPGRWVIWILLVLGAVVMMFPIYWVVVSAVSPSAHLQSSGLHLWPTSVVWTNFDDAWNSQPVGRWILNSFIIAGGSVLIGLVISMLAGYAFAKHRFPGRGMLFLAFVGTIMVPFEVIMVPEFVVVAKLGLVDTVWAVILPGCAQATSIFISRQFMLSIPDSLLEAARIDGARELGIFFRIVLPMSGPLVGVLVILTFVSRWNDFLWPLIVLQGQNHFTMTIGLNSLNNEYSISWGTIMTITLISMLPAVIVFSLFQRYFVQGIASTGLK